MNVCVECALMHGLSLTLSHRVAIVLGLTLYHIVTIVFGSISVGKLNDQTGQLLSNIQQLTI